MKRAHQVTAVVCIVFAAFVMRRSLAMKLQTPLGPGPGYFPFWLSLIFAGLAAVMLVQATLERSAAGPAGPLVTRRATGASRRSSGRWWARWF